MKNIIFFWVYWWKGVNALGDWVSGVFLIPGLKPWATEAPGNGKR
jgi:hypothetical protein